MDRTVASAVAASPSTSSRALGVAGILGGAVLLAAFIVEIAPNLNSLRLVLFNVGSIAVGIAVQRRQGDSSPILARVATGAAVLANAWYLAMVVLSIGRPNPFAGDLGLGLLLGGVALWLADAAFGVVTVWLRVVSRWGALALAVGSVLALTGIDRLGLTSAANPTIFGPVSQIGLALNGLGWILLGLDVATRGRIAAARPQ